mmetsp:Transcript_11425/g.32085  ORF Transcript_11425/g.32085 Transcript_11425/m.32085 type:complete len:175 (+) Transcript_11425:636-1160(+)
MIHLEVILPVQKMDQEGQKRNQPRHVYSNPCEPETCVILALAIFLILRPESYSGDDTDQLFLGDHQSSRFNTGLRKFLSRAKNRGSAVDGDVAVDGGAAVNESEVVDGGEGVDGLVAELGSLMEELGSPKFATLPYHYSVDKDAVCYAASLCFPSLWNLTQFRGVLCTCLVSLV